MVARVVGKLGKLAGAVAEMPVSDDIVDESVPLPMLVAADPGTVVLTKMALLASTGNPEIEKEKSLNDGRTMRCCDRDNYRALSN